MVVSRRTPVGLKVFTRAAWTEEKDDYLIQLLLAQVNAGRFADSRFSKESWNEIMTGFNRRFDANSNLTQIKSRFQQVRAVTHPKRVCWLTRMCVCSSRRATLHSKSSLSTRTSAGIASVCCRQHRVMSGRRI